jgi:RNA polymerase sigma-70 factor (ECF subfamily)
MATRILRDRSLAEDAVQETFMGVWRNAARYRSEMGSAKAWIIAIARNRAIDILRKRRGVTVELTPRITGGLAGRDVWAEVSERLDRTMLLELIAVLPDAQRRAIELAYLSGLTHTEIAVATGIPLGTIKSRVRSGLLALRRMIELASADVPRSVADARPRLPIPSRENLFGT